jgi:hypothetical protein
MSAIADCRFRRLPGLGAAVLFQMLDEGGRNRLLGRGIHPGCGHFPPVLHRRTWHFYTIANGARLMCSWNTQEEDIRALVKDLQTIAAMG